MTVKIREIKETPVELWYNNEKIGVIETELQLNDIRCQIKEQKLEGYYILFTQNDNTIQINITEYGTLDNWPSGFFGTCEKQLMFLCGWSKNYGNAG